MKTAQEIAQTLLNRRNAMNPVVMQGEMIAALESDGLQEALQRRWLVPQMETGFLMVSQEATKVQEMREIAAAAAPAPNAESKPVTTDAWDKAWARPNESHDFALRHSGRNISELLSPGTGHDSGTLRTPPPATPAPTSSAAPAPAAVPPAKPPAPPAAAAPGAQRPVIGDDVTVVSGAPGATESQTFTGKVTKNENGTVTVNFGNGEREFPENQVKVNQRAA